ncbi:hypothetical protein [Pseudostreptobacillus hongkongensis]|uniref:hypothetical protein n=1 Tax=Pseudostreptobacillus hongkongensis TaxID=1162717 RepID=UPI0028D2D49E|nr:hypothetical protein [Pseudostreptobacillus hongkongensis]
MNKFIEKKEMFIKNPKYLEKVKKRIDLLEQKNELTSVEERIYTVCKQELKDGIEAINLLLTEELPENTKLEFKEVLSVLIAN